MSAPGNFLHELIGSMLEGAAGNRTVAMIEAGFKHQRLHWHAKALDEALGLPRIP